MEGIIEKNVKAARKADNEATLKGLQEMYEYYKQGHPEPNEEVEAAYYNLIYHVNRE